MNSPNTSSEVDLELEQFAENYILARNDNNLDSMQFWVKRAKNLLHQSEIKGRIDELEKALLNISCFNPEVVKNRIEYLNQMKGE